MAYAYSTNLYLSGSYKSSFVSYGQNINEDITVNAFYSGYLSSPNSGGVINTGVRLGGNRYSPEYVWALTDSIIESKGGNDNYIIPSHTVTVPNLGLVNFKFGNIVIDTGGAGYNTLKWDNVEAFKLYQNGVNNLAITKNGKNLNILFKWDNFKTNDYGTLVVKDWYDITSDHKIEKFIFNSSQGTKLIRNASLIEAMVANKKIIDISITDYLSSAAKFVAGSISVVELLIQITRVDILIGIVMINLLELKILLAQKMQILLPETPVLTC